MLCPECQGNTKVVDTRSPSSSDSESSWVKSLLKHGERVFGWWSDDFRVRRRECSICGQRFVTIEVTAVDLEDAFTEAMQGDSFDVPWKIYERPKYNLDLNK